MEANGSVLLLTLQTPLPALPGLGGLGEGSVRVLLAGG